MTGYYRNSHLVIRNLTAYSSPLQQLDLRFDLFNGPFPYFVQNLSFQTSLDLSFNQLGFSIPSWLLDKRNIESLSLGDNHFNGVEGGIMSIIGRLCSLKNLDLSNNQLQDCVSKSHVNYSRGSRYDLEQLYLFNNNISGHLPIIESMSSLQELHLSQNKFETLPLSFGGLSSLEFLELSYNQLSTIANQVTLANLSTLTILDISSNSISFDLPSNWMSPFQLEYLYMSSCKINTSFPKWLLSQKYISDLDLSGSGIFRHLPNNIGTAMPSLTNLQLARNSISGSIPRSLCKLASLRSIDLTNNRLSGMIPDCWMMNSTIKKVKLSSNQLSGPIPNSFTKLSMLTNLDVCKNNLHGEIPAWNGSNFPWLEVLILRENNFKGVIPQQLCSIQNLRVIELANNALVGTIPHCFGITKALQSPDSIDPNSLRLIYLENIDFSCNNLVGVIPSYITSLSLLFSLDLSHNHLTGPIPMDIGNLEFLEYLDLSCNKLSGSIPESISFIDSLAVLDLSFNNLHGQIPTGSNFQTLDDPSIYMGNPGLCGNPLPNKCSNAHPPTTTVIEDEEEDNKLEKMWFYLVIMLGFATGFWGFIGILVVKKRSRYAFFQLVEDVADWLYVRVAVRIA